MAQRALKGREYQEFITFLKRIGFGTFLPKFRKNKLFWQKLIEKVPEIHFKLKDYNMPLEQHRLLRQVLLYDLCQPTVMLDNWDYALSMWDFWVRSYQLEYAARTSFGPDTKIMKSIKVFNSAMKESVSTVHKLFNYTFAEKLNMLSHPETVCYGFEWEPDLDSDPYKITIWIEQKQCKRKSLIIDGIKRIVYRPEYCIRERLLHHPYVVYEENEYDVYMQGHSLRRLEERLDTMPNRMVRSYLTRSLLGRELQIHKKRLLLPFHLESVLLGYFVCELISDICVLKTFLFISQDGTPEGDALTDLLQIKKFEKRHLKLEKLSHFTESDIRGDEVLVTLLKECGLGHLLTELRSVNDAPTENATYLRTVLQLENVQKEVVS